MQILKPSGTALIAILIISTVLFASMPLHADTLSNGTQVAVSLKNDELPASDLIYVDGSGNSRILSPEEAWQLKSSHGVDLSTLEPDATTDIWQGPSTAADTAVDQALPLQNGDTVSFLSAIASSPGKFRFNVQVQSQDGLSRTLTLMIAKDLHTTLLRKELLRRLGYKIPAMKYLSQIHVQFADILTRDFLLKTQLPNATLGAASRWQIGGDDPANAENTTITLQDLVATEATPLYYNVALAPPIDLISDSANIRAAGPRILRVLALPYGLLNIAESINQVDWYFGQVQNNSVILQTNEQNNFSCTLDDALWMLRRITALSRSDFAQIIAGAYYPKGVAEVLTEKLISRKNNLAEVFGVKDKSTAVNAKVTIKPGVENGKVLQQDWPGYASRFAYGDQESPLKGLQWYLISEVESNLIGNLLAQANAAIPAKTIEGDVSQHQNDLYTQGLIKYITTGQNQAVRLGVWASPLASGGIDISRDVVLGSYLGTNNLVQLADTFGLHINAGLFIGVDGLSPAIALQGLVSGSLSINVTHVKPLTALKQAVTEPIRNEFVPWIFKHASGIFSKINDSSTHTDPTVTPDQLKKALAADLDELTGFLGIGESLILTESASGNESLTLAAQTKVSFTPSAGLQVGSDQLVISRLHFLRKDASTILVFKDKGELTDVNLSFEVSLGSPTQFPILSLTGKKGSGKADSKIFNVNVNPDPAANPNLYSNSNALSAALKSGSTEVLESVQKPTEVSIGFHDNSSSFKFFHYLYRSLNTNGKVDIILPDGTHGTYVALSDGDQSGSRNQGLATDAASYLVQRLSKSQTTGIDTQTASNPGQSFLGSSHTREATFQARIDSGVTNPFARIQYRWEGWNISAKDIQKIVDGLNLTYGFKLYPDGFLLDTDSIKMYQISLSMHLYEAAINRIISLSSADELLLERPYAVKYQCFSSANPYKVSGPEIDTDRCNGLNHFQNAYTKLRKGITDTEQNAQVTFDLVNSLEQFASFDDILTVIGGFEGYYVYSTISGFRSGTEDVMKPLNSNSIGQVDPNNPNGALTTVQQILGIDSGEFGMQWLRDHL